jgi:stearoyl-CoA desaturase (delta-9 desaturase)
MIYPHWAENYAAKHRKHHKYSDTEQDPHSPFYQSLGEIMDQRNHSITLEEIKLYAPDIITPVTWMDKNVYFKYPKLGLAVHWLGQTLAFGIPGFIIGMLFYFYIAHVFFFCGNYLVHKIGFTCATNKGADRSKIVFPIGIIMGGEELHANHHNDVTNPNFRKRWWEFDSGWMYAKLLIAAGLVKIVK